MTTVVGIAFTISFLVAHQLLVVNAVHRVPALKKWQPVMSVCALVWWITPLLKKAFVDDVFYPNDSVVHEEMAREVAYLISNGDWRLLRGYYGFGNEGYRFVLGCFYALTNAPEVTTYGLHGFLAFAGLLSVLQTACLHTQSRRVPLWVVLYCTASPSALFWTTFNLKEGAMLWGLCMVIRSSVRFSGVDPKDSIFWPMAGLIVSGFLRPHIAIAYLFALAVGYALSKRQFGILLVSGAGIFAALAILKTMSPVLFEQIAHDGISSALTEKFHELTMGDGSVISYRYGAPIPVLSGLLLICFRPFPWEVYNVTTLAPGVEVWMISMAAMIYWLRSPNRKDLFWSPYFLTLLSALLAVSFYFSYMYNMGLMVRQRVMTFPILLSIAILPALAMAGRWNRNFLPKGPLLVPEDQRPIEGPSLRPSRSLRVENRSGRPSGRMVTGRR